MKLKPLLPFIFAISTSSCSMLGNVPGPESPQVIRAGAFVYATEDLKKAKTPEAVELHKAKLRELAAALRAADGGLTPATLYAVIAPHLDAGQKELLGLIVALAPPSAQVSGVGAGYLKAASEGIEMVSGSA